MPTSYDNLQPSLALTQTIVTSGAFLGHDSGTGAGIAFVRNFAGNFGMSAQPLAHGQLLPILQNTALFSLIGTYYGGNGTSTFALPNLDGRVAVGAGTGPGLTERLQGEQFGQDTVYLGQSNLPASSGGTSAAFDNDQPSLAMHYMIQVQGVFPSDNGGSVYVGNQLMGDVALFAGDFSPSGGWMDCDGRLLNISEYDALFNLIGTTYGGDGQTTFGLPDLRGRAIVGAGQGGGMPNLFLGEALGSETGQLSSIQMPSDMGGGSVPVQNSQPSLALNYMIALQGVFPSSDSGGGYEDNSAVYIGEVMATALNTAPGGFALCQGQLLSIQQNQALFSILGTMYGGNGITNFALPDLRGRSIIGTDANHLPGERFGTSSFSVTSIDAPLVINDDDNAHNLYGGEADDTINGNGGADTLQGNGGADRLNGGIDADTMLGGTGDDTYIVDNIHDVVTELNDEGSDTVQVAVDYILGANVENLVLLSTRNGNGSGNALDNVILGNAGTNALKGLGGKDFIDGKGGADRMYGGFDDDTYVVDNVADLVVENAGEGSDTVQTALDYILGANLENLTLTGGLNSNGTGNSLVNTILGNSGNNRIDGKGGADTMTGGLGDDTYVVDIAGDVVTELSGQGIDTVETALDYTLGANLEGLTLLGAANKNGTGNALDNVLTGNSGANALKGLGGKDFIDGKGGADRMYGGTNDDTYVVDNVADLVVENIGEGIDTVQTALDFTLGANLENLTLLGAANKNGTGNALDNVLTGNSGANALQGLDGKDTLDGKGGADRMYGGIGDDSYVVDNVGDLVVENAGEGTDTVQSSIAFILGADIENLILTGLGNLDGAGNALGNSLNGNAGNNRLDGKSGTDTMTGGLGDDTYIVDTATDLVTELNSQGTDTIETTLDFTLGGNLENLTLIGTRNANGIGNALNNALTGNARNNILKGLDGVDRLEGKAGSDVLYGGLNADTFVFNLSDSAAAATTDSVMDLNFAQSDVLSFVGFGGIVPTITSYHDLATFVTQTGASVVAGPTAGVAQLTLMGANGHTQTINLTDTSGNGTALQQYQAAAGSLTLLSTGLPMGSSLTYYARFVDAKGGVISSDGNNGWVALQSFSEGAGNAFVTFGSDRAATSLYASMMHGTQVGIEVEAYQTVNGQLQLVDQYLFEHDTVISHSGGTSQQAFSFNVGQVEHDHWARDAKGALQAPTEFGWDYNSKSTVNLSERASFIADGKVAGGQDQGLQYVVRVFDAKGTVIASEGSNGWMTTNGLSLNVFQGKAELSNFLLNSGKASIPISNALQSDSSLRVEVEAYKVTANGIVTVDEYLFSNVHVSGQQPSAADGATPQEGVSFSYDAFQQTHNTLDASNKVTATSQSGWNFVTKSDAVITDVGDFTAADTTGPAPADRILVGRFVDSKGVVIGSEGTNGWVAVSSLGFNADSNNYHPPGGQAQEPLLANVNITGSDKLALALERAQLAGTKVSFQVESLALIGGQYTQVDEYLFSGASIIASVGVDGFTSFSASVDAFTHTYAAHDAKGAVTSTSATGWNFITKAQVTLPDTVDFMATDHTASPDDDLTYVVRFLDSGGKFIASDAGSSGWIATTSVFSIANGEAQLDLRVTDDAARLALTTAMLNGTSVRADVEVYRTTASGLQLVDDYLFANVAVNALSTSDSGQTEVSLTPLQYTHLHNVYDAKGVATQSTSGWDFKANSATTLSDVGNYATGGVPAVAVDQLTHLTYYARFLDANGTPLSSDGSGGWVALSVFGESVRNYGGSKAGEVVINFGDDQLFQALNLANLNGTTSLTLEVDGFAGTQLVDQNLFAQINIRQLADPNGGTNPFYIDFQQSQSTHYLDSKTSVSQGWYLGTGAVPAPLSSVGAYNPAIPAGGGAPDHITYYMKLLDKNGLTILTDGGHAFSEISGMSPSLFAGAPNAYLSVVLGSDQSLLATFQALVQGQTLSQIEIEAYVDSPTGPRLIDEYLFTGASPAAQYEAGSPYSTLTFAFTKFQQVHEYDTGKGYAASLSGWDFALDHAVSSFVTPHADLFS